MLSLFLWLPKVSLPTRHFKSVPGSNFVQFTSLSDRDKLQDVSCEESGKSLRKKSVYQLAEFRQGHLLGRGWTCPHFNELVNYLLSSLTCQFQLKRLRESWRQRAGVVPSPRVPGLSFSFALGLVLYLDVFFGSSPKQIWGKCISFVASSWLHKGVKSKIIFYLLL